MIGKEGCMDLLSGNMAALSCKMQDRAEVF